MAPGRKALRRLQLAKEVTPGTAVTATTRWHGNGVLKDDREVLEILEDIGVLGGLDRTVITKYLGMLELENTPMTFEQFQYLVASGLGGPTTGSADGGGSDKIYTTNMPTTAAPTLVPYTWEGGDDFEQEYMEYGVSQKIHLEGKAGDVAMMGGTIMGRQVRRLVAGFTTTTIPTVEEVLVGKGKVYINAVSAAYGNTQIVNQILGYSLDFVIKLIPKFTMDGNLYYSYPQFVDWEVTGSVTFEHDTAVDGNTGAKADFRAQTPRKLRIDLIGNNVTTPGTTYSQKHAIIDLPLKYTDAGLLADQEGNDIIEMPIRARYNATAGDAGKIVIVSELSSLP
jgi:hypothetical protein